MKSLILIISILLVLSSNTKSFAQWQNIYPGDSTSVPGLFSVYFVIYNNGMACGFDGFNKGIIIRTKDSGITWDTVLSSPNSLSYVKIIFSDLNTAFAIGYQNITRTTDFGNSWDTLITIANLFSISFPSQSIGYVVGTGGTILKTSDAGNNWINLNSMTNDHLYSVYFINDTIGFACGDSIILKTNDGGNNWSNINIGGAFSGIPYAKIFFSSDSIGYYMKNDGLGFITHLYKTINSGLGWNLHSTLDTNGTYTSLFFTNDTTGYAMGWFSMYKTIDGGTNWTYQNGYPWQFGNEMQDVFFLNNDTGFAVGPCSFFKTTNGGECVIPKSFNFTDSLLTVYFYDSMFNSTSWYWDFGDGNTSIVQNPVHIYDSAAIYRVCLTATSICDTVTICDSIKVTCPKPISLFNYKDSLLSVSFSDSSTSATNWFWDFGDGDTSILQNPAYTYLNSGTYTVTLIVSNVCGSDSSIQSILVNAVGISAPVMNQIKLYPNLLSKDDFIHLDISGDDKVRFEIYNMLGDKLIHQTFMPG